MCIGKHILKSCLITFQNCQPLKSLCQISLNYWLDENIYVLYIKFVVNVIVSSTTPHVSGLVREQPIYGYF